MQRLTKIAVCALFLLGGVITPVQQALASDAWCSDDPIVLVQNKTYDIVVEVPIADRNNAGMVTVYVPTPPGAKAQVLTIDNANFKEQVVFVAHGGNPMQTTAVSSNGVPTRVTVRRLR